MLERYSVHVSKLPPPFYFLIIYIKIIYLFLAALCFWAWAFSSCGEWGLLLVAMHKLVALGLSCASA